ncbi:MAG: glycosyltransferase family 4 protein [Mycobacteriales bacterium]
MRTTVVIDGYPGVFGGAHRYLVNLEPELADQGWQIRVVLPADGPAAEALGAAGIEVSIVPAPAALLRFGRAGRGARRAAAVGRLPRYWARLGPVLVGADVVHLHDHRGLVLGARPASWAGLPMIWHLHAPARAPLLDAVGARLAARVVTPSQATAAALPKKLARRAVVVYNPVPCGEHPAPVRGSRTFVAAARLHPVKGLDLLVEAARILRRGGREHRMVLLGGVQPGYESYARELANQVRTARLEDTVSLPGAVADPRPYWQRALAHVQPSRAETFGLAVVEAAAEGVPAVACAVGGLPEAIQHGVTGLLVPPEDPVALADALASLLDDPDRAADLGAAARERVRREFAPAGAARRWAELYTAVCRR